MLTIGMRDEKYRYRGLLKASKVELITRLNEPDTFIVDVAPELAQQATRLREGWGLVLHDGGLRVSGVITAFHRTAKDNALEVEVTCTSELVFLKDRLTYPDPSHPEDQQTAARYQDRGPAETIIKRITSRNLGPGAIPTRRIEGFHITDDGGRGSTTAIDTRLKNLLDTLTPIATAAGLRMTATYQDGKINFDTIPFKNRARAVRLSYLSGEVVGWEMTDRVGTATAVVVGGQGEGEDRKLTSQTRNDSWLRRIEIFKDRRDSDNPETLTAAANEELEKAKSDRSMKITLYETETRRLGEAFNIGDTVTIDAAAHVTPYSAQIVEAKISWENNTRTVELTIGALDTTLRQAEIERLRNEVAALATI